MTLTDEKRETKKRTDKFLNDYYATKLLSDKDSEEYLLKIISKAVGVNFEDVKKDFELVDLRLGISRDTKDTEADLLAKSGLGYINIEVNYKYGKTTDIKNTGYICQLILRQIKPGGMSKYTDLKNIYQINIDGFDYFKKNKFIYRSSLMEDQLHIPRRNSFVKIIDINLDFLRKIDYTTIKDYESDSLEKMLYIFINDDKRELDEIYLGDVIMEKIKSKLYDLDIENLDKYLIYDREELRRSDAYCEGLELGKQEGLKEGLKQWIKEGIKQGIEQGIFQKEKELIKILAKKMSPKEIENLLGISTEKINSYLNY